MPVKTILILSPHTDDGEFGCGASMAKYVENGHKVINVAFSDCAKSLPPELAPDTLRKECTASAKSLNLHDVRILDYEVREFPRDRQAILEEMVKLNKEFKPDVVLMPCTTDWHQDHQTINSEGKRAFKRSNLLGYELPWNNITFTSNFFHTLSDAQVHAKAKALECYKSQSFRNYYSEQFVRSLAYTRGTQVGADYAEAFELIRWIE